MEYRPDGVMLSNGPGDPADIPEAIDTQYAVFRQVSIFGICLGHQLISLACGARTSTSSAIVDPTNSVNCLQGV